MEQLVTNLRYTRSSAGEVISWLQKNVREGLDVRLRIEPENEYGPETTDIDIYDSYGDLIATIEYCDEIDLLSTGEIAIFPWDGSRIITEPVKTNHAEKR